MRPLPHIRLAFIGLLVTASSAIAQNDRPAWSGYSGDAQHTNVSRAATQPLERVLWSTPVDLDPQYTFGILYVHYGSPAITKKNTIIIPVKTGMTDGFRVEARNGATGELIYTQATDYTIATGTSWYPSYGPALSRNNKLHLPGMGGTILRRHNADNASQTAVRLAFFGLANYSADPTPYNDNVKIHTPLTLDDRNDAWFGYRVYGATPLNIQSGIAVVRHDGLGQWRSVVDITGDATATQIQTQCAPAVSNDGKTIYFGIQRSVGGGYVVGIDSETLATKYSRRLYDPASGFDAIVTGQSSSSVMVGPDGDVYFGVLANPDPHNYRGYLLHFNEDLSAERLPGSFGWDITPSIVTSASVPGYSGTSPYLIVTKYNNYAFTPTGDGDNKMGLLDPFDATPDFISSIPTMREIYLKSGPTSDPNANTYYPNAVYEWCVNATAYDPATSSAIVNSEDGHVYRWDFTTNTLSQGVALGGPLYQAYTPTVTGPTGISYAINNARLYAVGAN